MQLGEFDLQMQRLKSNYGATHYGEEKQKILLREIKQFSNQQFTKIVDELISSEGRPPTVKLIVSKFVRVREGLNKTQSLSHWTSNYNCNNCDDSGWKFIHDPNYFNTVTRCSCSKGIQIKIPFKL